MSANPDLAFEQLEQHAPFLRRLARALVRDEHGAEDLAQETWLAALRRPPADGEGARGWVARIARNRARDEAKLASRRAAREREAARPEAQPPESGLEERVELARELLAAVRALREPYRETVWLRFYEGLAPREIARRQGVPLETVRTRLVRAKAELKERLGERERWLPGMAALAGLRGPEAAALGGGVGVLALAGGLALAIGVVLAIAGVWAAAPKPSPVPSLVADAAAPPAGPERAAEARPTAAPERAALAGAPAEAGRTSFVAPEETGPAVLAGSVRWTAARVEPWSRTEVAVVRVVDGVPEPLDSTSAPGGWFELEVPGGGDVLFVAVAEGAPVITRAFTLPPSGRTEVEVLEPGLGCELAGRAVDGDGAPLAGARLEVRRADADFFRPLLSLTTHGSVSVQQGRRPASEQAPISISSSTLLLRGGAFVRASAGARTGADGEFRIQGLAPGAYGVDVVPKPPAETPLAPVLHLRALSDPPRVHAPATNAEVVWRERRLAIRVLDGERPLDGVSVRVGDERDARRYALDPDSDWPLRIGLSADGRIAVGYPEGEDPVLLVSRAGRHPLLLRLADCAPDADGNVIVRLVRAHPTATLRLRLAAPDGVLPPALEVVLGPALRPGGGPPAATLRRVLDPVAAETLLEDVPPGAYQLKLELRGARFLPVEQEVLVTDGENELELELRPGGVLELESDRFVHMDEGLRFHARNTAGEERSLQLAPGSLAPGDVGSLTPVLPPGEWTLSAVRRGRTIWSSPARLVAGEATRLAVSLPPPD